jgi:predicted nucleotidyltransferase
MVNRENGLNIAKSFVFECLANGIHFYKVFLFGSAAKNQSHEWSDIDLLLVSDDFSDNIFENLDIYSKINFKYPIIETHPYPTKYYLEGDDFLNEISKESVEVVI